MKTSNHTCTECGVALAEDAPMGLCPQCLLKAGLNQANLKSNLSGLTTQVTPSDGASTPGNSQITLGNPHPIIRYFGDYELLEEIAHGGMGVVYKARQVSLNRIVAVKMILAGQFASDAEVKRFRIEAESAANLQHPNIVAIHEVGVHEGRHYFSMDYVEGKNLTEMLVGKPMPSSQAATLMKLIAEAVHYAHQRGILHRDLKPQNILVDAQAQPRITDFGLAKRILQDSNLTCSGVIMGSPSYMPPEQAAGRMAELGPHSDVYSLGAILYELLTGEPPFKGQTPQATLREVLEEPLSPSKFHPGTPKDLMTICMKCLEKRVERRYHSARELAEELERYLNHEPIIARPVQPIHRAWNWLQRKPWTIAALVAMLGLGAICFAYGFWEKTRQMEWVLTHPGELYSFEVQPVLISLLLVCYFFFLGWGYFESSFRRHFQRWKEEGIPIPHDFLWAYGIFGFLVITYCLIVMLKGIELNIWWPYADIKSMPGRNLILIACLFLVWGANILWKTVGMHESAVYREIVDRYVTEGLAKEKSAKLNNPPVHVGQVLLFSLALFVCFMGIVIFVGILISVVLHENRPAIQNIAFMISGIFMLILTAIYKYPHLKSVRLQRAILISLLILTDGAVICMIVLHPQNLLLKGIFMGSFLGGLIGLSLIAALKMIQHSIRLTYTAKHAGKPVPETVKDHESKLLEKSVPATSRIYISGIITILGFAVLGFHTVKTYQAASSAYQHWYYLQNTVQTAGDTRRFQKLPPDELNFAKTPAWENMAYLGKSTGATNQQHFDRFSLPLNSEVIGDFNLGLKCSLAAIHHVWHTDTNENPAVATNSVAEVLDFMKNIESEMEELRLATRRPYAACKPLIFKLIKHSESMYNANQPNVKNIKLLASIFSIHASALLASERSEEAFIDFQVINKIAASLENHPTPSVLMLRTRVLERALQVFWEGLVQRQWTVTQLQLFSNAFQGHNLLKNLDEALGYGEATYLRCQIDYSFGKDRILFPWLIQSQLLDLAQIHELCLTTYDALQLRVYPLKSNRFAPKLKADLQTIAFMQTSINQAYLACALELYRRSNGNFPYALDDLIPRFVEKLPHDIITGEPLKYRRTDDGQFILYSVGWNEMDDGGVAFSDQKQQNKLDWVWITAAKE